MEINPESESSAIANIEYKTNDRYKGEIDNGLFAFKKGVFSFFDKKTEKYKNSNFTFSKGFPTQGAGIFRCPINKYQLHISEDKEKNSKLITAQGTIFEGNIEFGEIIGPQKVTFPTGKII